jgi:GTP-binding protein
MSPEPAIPTKKKALPMVAVVGRPNVGKSTLVNRLIGRRETIVEERPGVTRDRKVVECEWLGRFFNLMDTGGWIGGGESLDDKVSAQSETAMENADVVLFVVDTTVGVTADDEDVASLVRRIDAPVLLVANKVDDVSREPLVWEFMNLGLGEPHPISALHGNGAGDLLDEILTYTHPETLGDSKSGRSRDPHASVSDDPDDGSKANGDDDTGDEDDGAPSFSVSIVGRPNVGKSTLFNRIIGEERSVVHDMPGTTRDAIDTVIETDDGSLVRFVDTAGMRRRSRVDDGTEYFSMVRALRAVDRSDVAVLVIDANEGVTHQDQRIAERVDGAGCPIVVLMNKWETLDAEQRLVVNADVERRLHFVGEDQVLRISALSGKGVQRLLPTIMVAVAEYHRRVPTGQLNQVIRRAQQATPAPKGARVLYATQGATDPPTFTLFSNRTLPPTYMRYLERVIREEFGLEHTPVKLRVRRRD